MMYFSSVVFLPHGRFIALHPKPTMCTHVVWNYIGPNNGEGIRIFYNGAEKSRGEITFGGQYSAGDLRIIVGRFSTAVVLYYASVEMDELIFFNQALTLEEIKALATSA